MRIQNKEVIMLEITNGQFNMMSIFLVINITIRPVLPCAGLLLCSIPALLNLLNTRNWTENSYFEPGLKVSKDPQQLGNIIIRGSN